MGPPRKCKNKSVPSSVKPVCPIEIKSQKTSSNNISVFNYLNNISYGDYSKSVTKRFCKTCIVNYLPELDTCKTMRIFERRVTAIEWHPKYPKIFAAGSKGGELFFLNLLSSSSSSIPGIGPGGSIVALKFTSDDLNSVYTASITGKIRRECFYDKTGKTFLSSNNFRNWYTSLDVTLDKKLILVGDCNGNGMLLTADKGEKVWRNVKCLHKGKVSHIEMCLLDANIFATASIDHTAKIWDLRKIVGTDGKPNPVCTFTHLKGVNSAYFSPSNRNALLTTDQHNEIRVYKSPGWTEELIIPHPHRQFQHLTPIKATWHPFEDIIVVGRYPDDKFKKSDSRTIDYFDGSTGDLLHRNKSITGGVSSLNAFNITGDYLASVSGSCISFKASKDKLNKFPEVTSEILNLYLNS